MEQHSMRVYRVHRIDAVMHFAALAYVGESVLRQAATMTSTSTEPMSLDAMVRAECSGDRILVELRHLWRA